MKWPNSMKHYPSTKEIKELILSNGISGADQKLQEAMVNSAKNKVTANMESLEEHGNLETTGYGQKWIASNLEFLAEKIISRPTTEIVKSFIDFPEKIKFKGETVSTSGYLNNLTEYRSKGLKSKKIAKDAEHDREQQKIEDFVKGAFGARSRARTVALIVLSNVLKEAIGIVDNPAKLDSVEEEKSGSLTIVAKGIIIDVLGQAIARREKDLRAVMPVPNTVTVCKDHLFLTMAGKANVKGKKLIDILGIKSIKSISEAERLKEGHLLLRLVDEVIDDISIFNGEIDLTEEVHEELSKSREGIITRATEMRPVLEKPISDGIATSYRKAPLKSKILDSWLDVDKSTLSPLDVEAVRKIQGTPFKINVPYLKAIKQALESGLHIHEKLNVKVPDRLEMLTAFPKFNKEVSKEEFRKQKDAWFKDEQNKKDFIEWKKKSEKRDKDIAKAISINDMNLRTIEIAEYYAELGTFYLPVYMDYRTRIYYCPTILNPQSSKLAKAMFVAAEAEEITEDGMDFWLVNYANSMKTVTSFSGQEYAGDKSPWNVALYAAKNELTVGAKVAADPLHTFPIWSVQDDPFAYLSQSFECADVIHRGHLSKSRIFLNLDGSNNGAQWASGYLLDKDTAELVNMTYKTADEAPADMYQTVADCFKAQLGAAAIGMHFQKMNLITRKTCKRIVMCMNYGLTMGGALNYAKEEIEKFTDKDNNNPLDATASREEVCNYFRDGVWDAVAEVAPAILRTKEAMCEVGKMVCHFGDGRVKLETFTGTKTSFTKHQEKKVTVNLTFRGKAGKFCIKRTDREKIADTEVANATPPNFTHMNDATHLRLVALAMPESAPTMWIHDSFGTIAKYAKMLARLTRQKFITMFKNRDPLREFVMLNLDSIGQELEINVDFLLDNDVDHLEHEGEKRKFVKGINKIKKNIKRTEDLDLESIMDCIYFFR